MEISMAWHVGVPGTPAAFTPGTAPGAFGSVNLIGVLNPAIKPIVMTSKGYRYAWGQQVLRMMGTAADGPDQGVVTSRVEIAPDGRLAGLEILWTTSIVAELLARNAIESPPPLPITSTSKPLIFERTISFTPLVSDGPPIYKDDCLAEPPEFSNPCA